MFKSFINDDHEENYEQSKTYTRCKSFKVSSRNLKWEINDKSNENDISSDI